MRYKLLGPFRLRVARLRGEAAESGDPKRSAGARFCGGDQPEPSAARRYIVFIDPENRTVVERERKEYSSGVRSALSHACERENGFWTL
jgi:hypothetical protein